MTDCRRSVVAEDGSGVDVDLAAAHADVQPVAGRAEHFALADSSATPDSDAGDSRIRDTQPVRMGDGEVQPSSDRPSEAHNTLRCRPVERTGLRRDLQTAVAGPVWMQRRSEWINDRSHDWPHVVDGPHPWCRLRRCGHCGREHRARAHTHGDRQRNDRARYAAP